MLGASLVLLGMGLVASRPHTNQYTIVAVTPREGKYLITVRDPRTPDGMATIVGRFSDYVVGDRIPLVRGSDGALREDSSFDPWIGAALLPVAATFVYITTRPYRLASDILRDRCHDESDE